MDPRKILGVDPNASHEEIQRAYRQQVKKHHPDLGGDSWAFQQVQEAYEALTNPKAPTTSKSNPGPATPKPTPRPATRNSPPANKRQKTQSGSSQRKTQQQNPRRPKRQSAHEERHWWQLFVGELPLQIETMLFILVNCLDIFLTHKLMRAGAVEANPIANYFFRLWNFNGMIAFKLTIVAVVCVIAHFIALKRIKTAQALLLAGILLVSAVVVYSIRLYMIHFYF